METFGERGLFRGLAVLVGEGIVPARFNRGSGRPLAKSSFHGEEAQTRWRHWRFQHLYHGFLLHCWSWTTATTCVHFIAMSRLRRGFTLGSDNPSFEALPYLHPFR